MEIAPSSRSRLAPKSRIFQARWLAVAFLLVVVAAGRAEGAQTDHRSEVQIRAHLNEPTWAFVGNAVEVFIDFVVPVPDDPRRPTGTLTLEMNERGAVPEVRTLTGDEGDVHIYITPVRTGKRQYTVTYSGDEYFRPSKKTFSYDVWTGPQTKTTIEASAKRPITVSEAVKLTAQVTTDDGRQLTGYSDGPIAFYSDGEFIGEGTPVSGSRGWRATLTVAYLPAGTHSLTARHESFIRYWGPESAPVVLQVLPPLNPIPLDGENTLSVVDDFTVHSEVTLTPQQANSPVPAGYVQFYSDDIAFGLPVPVVNGKAAVDFWLPTFPRTFTFRADYLGDTHYNPIDFPSETLTVPLP